MSKYLVSLTLTATILLGDDTAQPPRTSKSQEKNLECLDLNKKRKRMYRLV
jgi:hypothetical protein